MNNFMTPTRKGLPPEAELIPSGSSPGWMKNLSFKEVYTNFDDGDTDQQEFLRTSHGDGSIFIDGNSIDKNFVICSKIFWKTIRQKVILMKT